MSTLAYSTLGLQHSSKLLHGGGILAAIHRNIDIVSSKFKYKCPAEILGITLKFRDGSKLILCNFNRVGNLGTINHHVFQDYVRKARQRRGVTGIVIAGDLNLPGIDWQNYFSTDPVEQLFLDSFSNGIEQLITSPTHTEGNILDLVLTDKLHFISDIQISELDTSCKSDHFALSFKGPCLYRRCSHSHYLCLFYPQVIKLHTFWHILEHHPSSR